MKKLTTEEYKKQQAACDDLCNVTDELAEEKEFKRCVTCPFCKEIVTAILTKTTIACPECKVVVPRS